MVLKNLSDLKNIAVNGPKRKLILAAAQDKDCLAAVIKAWQDGVIEPVLVSDESNIREICDANHFNIDGISVVNEPDIETAVQTSVRLVHNKEGDILMKGKAGTSTILKSVLDKQWGLRSGRLLSHIALFEVEAYSKVFAVTDVAMNIAPKLKEKIAILNNSVSCLNALGYKCPKVAILGAVEMVNENMEATLDAALLSKMNQREQIKNCIIDGPLAFDNAVSYESAIQKGIKSEVAGDTDLLLMPDIEVGNVLYKSLVFFAKAKVASMILGAIVPIVLTSRSDSEQSKYFSVLLAAGATK